jgi:hypothetical protein
VLNAMPLQFMLTLRKKLCLEKLLFRVIQNLHC